MTTQAETSIQGRLAGYFESQAQWREMKAEEFPADNRNQSSAMSLRQLAEHVRSLPDDDPRVVAVKEYAALYEIEHSGLEGGLGGSPAPASRIGFSNRRVNIDDELSWYVEANLAEQIHQDQGEAPEALARLREIQLAFLQAQQA